MVFVIESHQWLRERGQGATQKFLKGIVARIVGRR